MGEPKKLKFIYAPLPRRLVAFLLDAFLIVSPIALLVGIIFGYDELKNPHPSFLMLLAELASIGIVFAAFWSRSGQTPGKKAMGLRVVDAKSFLPLSFARCVWRYAVWTLCWATFMLGFFVASFDKKRRTLADFACGSVVVLEL